MFGRPLLRFRPKNWKRRHKRVNINYMGEEITPNKIQEVADKIAEEFKPEKIILFGSYAWGKPGPDSDVDLFVIKRTDDTRQLSRDISGAIYPRPFALDILVYRPHIVEKELQAGDYFIEDVMNNGKVLYERTAA